VFVSTHWRNDTIQLFGFATTEEKQAFLLLTGITGVGPKLALSALSTLPVPNLCAAIESDDTETLASIPGVGKKSASRIILELKDKTNRIMISDAQKPSTSSIEPTNFLQEEASSALINLGYRALEVKKAINLAIDKIGETYELEDLIRTTLKELAKG
ncbi:MAG: Holliday junction branch migration protein RuvA, partial [Nitrospirales bacterium]